MTHQSDGKYITLDEVKGYGLGQIADPNNTTVYNGAVQGTPDDSILSQCIARAEMEFDRIAGIQFDRQTRTLVQAFTPFVDGTGWLNVWARENAPVTAVSAVQYRDLLKPSEGWMSLSFSNDDVILPINDGYGHPDSARVRIYAATLPAPRGTGELLVKWTYTGGFSTIPQSMKGTVARLSWWIYKLREAPLNQITLPQLGVVQVPLKIPQDIEADILLWQPAYS